MPAPKRTAPATEARKRTAAASRAKVRQGLETMATKLRAAGWVILPPEEAEMASQALRDLDRWLRSRASDGEGQ